MKALSILLVLALVQAASSQQAPQTASIEGAVVRYGTSDGISRARVTLTPAQSPSQSSTAGQAIIADMDGKFAFRNLAAGSYRLTVVRDGYVGSEYGQRGPNGSGVAITLAAQQRSNDIRIGMTSTGAIGGRIVNRFGEPVGNANVQALRVSYQDGRRVLNSVQAVRTNDRGEYRLYWLAPGQYIVSAQPIEPFTVDAGGTVFLQAGTGGRAAGIIAAAGGPQLGVGGVTRIVVGPGGAGMEGMTGPAGNSGGGGGGGGAAPQNAPSSNSAGAIAAAGGPQLGVGGVNRIVVGPGGGGAGGGGGGGAGAGPQPVPAPNAVVDNPEVYLPVFFPGTADIASAMAINLRGGGNEEGVNLTVVDARPVRVRGTVLSGGRPAAGAQVSLFQRSAANGSFAMRGATASDTGTFEFRNVAPGTYEIVASTNAAGTMTFVPFGAAAGMTPDSSGTVRITGAARASGQAMMGVRTSLDINAADVDGITLNLENGFNVAGKVAFDGTPGIDSNSSLAGVRIQLQSDPAIPPLAVPAINSEPNGAFSVTGVTPGLYRLTVSGLPRNTYIKSARLMGIDVTNNELRIDSEPRGSLDIVLGSTPGSLDVVALDDKQAPQPAVTVVLIPDGSQVKRMDAYRTATSDAAGKVHWDGLIPGDYKVYAWEDIERGAWTDPELMRNYQDRGTSVRIDERGRATVNARVSPYKSN